MKILFVSTNELSGGAAVAAKRISSSISKNGCEVFTAVLKKESDSKTVFCRNDPFSKALYNFKKVLERNEVQKHNLKFQFSTSLFPSVESKWLNSLNADLINLNWINNGFLSIKDISKLNKPIVWTLHDMWAFTGGCHYSGDCAKYKSECGACPLLGSSNPNDLSKKVFDEKKKLFSKKITFICPSKWLAHCVKKSALFKDSKIFVIPYPINLNLFKPSNKGKARRKFDLPADKKIILFGAVNARSDKRKGFDYLEKALLLLPEKLKKSSVVVVFGDKNKKSSILSGIQVISVGEIKSEKLLPLLYSTADVFVLPSVQDNLPNTVIESLTCGVPVVAFNVGGLPDMIIHKKNGYLADALNSKDLMNGLSWALQGDKVRISKDARRIAREMFNERKIAAEYIKVYKRVLVN